MRKLSRCDLEVISQRVLRAYWRLPEAQETPWYVDPDVLLKCLLGLKIDYRTLSEDGLTLGITSFAEVRVELPDCAPGELYCLDGKTVLIEKDLQLEDSNFGRRNFTLTHEGSHHILNMLFPGEYSGGSKVRQAVKYRITAQRSPIAWEEWQMDVLSSYLLMPEALVKSNMRLVGLPEKVDYLNPVWRKKAYDQFILLSELMGVSKEALSYRMQRLGVLGEDQRRQPNSLVEIWR